MNTFTSNFKHNFRVKYQQRLAKENEASKPSTTGNCSPTTEEFAIQSLLKQNQANNPLNLQFLWFSNNYYPQVSSCRNSNGLIASKVFSQEKYQKKQLSFRKTNNTNKLLLHQKNYSREFIRQTKYRTKIQWNSKQNIKSKDQLSMNINHIGTEIIDKKPILKVNAAMCVRQILIRFTERKAKLTVDDPSQMSRISAIKQKSFFVTKLKVKKRSKSNIVGQRTDKKEFNNQFLLA